MIQWRSIGIQTARKRDGGDGDAWLLAGGNHFGFEFGAAPTQQASVCRRRVPGGGARSRRRRTEQATFRTSKAAVRKPENFGGARRSGHIDGLWKWRIAGSTVSGNCWFTMKNSGVASWRYTTWSQPPSCFERCRSWSTLFTDKFLAFTEYMRVPIGQLHLREARTHSPTMATV